MGIFVPLLFLLIALAAAAPGAAPVPLATTWFKLVVGVTVNVAALGYLLVREHAPIEVPFRPTTSSCSASELRGSSAWSACGGLAGDHGRAFKVILNF